MTLCHWILSDLVRTLRITAQAPLRELPYEALTPIIPVTFGSGPSVGTFVFDGTEQTLILPHSTIAWISSLQKLTFLSGLHSLS